MPTSLTSNDGHAHVCLISDQPIPNLLPLLNEQPGQAIFLVSPQMSAQAERLRKVVQPHGVRVAMREISAYDFDSSVAAYPVAVCQVAMREISAYDFDAVANTCEQLLADIPGPGLTLNVTGGTKIAALAAFQVFFFGNRRIIYCDTENARIMQLSPERGETAITGNSVRVRDYLTVYGVAPVDGGKPPSGAEDRHRHLAGLATLLVKQEGLLARCNSALEKQGKKSFANLSLNELGPGGEELADLLCRCGVAGFSGNTLNIPSKEKMFFCKGGWLEEYTYWSAKDLGIKGLDPAINVKIQWDGKGRRPTENEFDVLFTHHNRLHIISCKAANPERETETGTRATEALNELDTLKDRAGGLFGKAMLVSVRRLRDHDRERAAKMQIELVDGQNVLRLKERLRTWLDPP